MITRPGISTFLIWSSTLVCACGWGISAIAVFLPTERAFAVLGAMAEQAIPAIPMLDYWLRMTAVAFTFIGFLFLFTLTDIRRYRPLGLAMAVFQILCGVVLLVSAMRLGLPEHVFVWDVVFCLSSGFVLCGSSIAARVTESGHGAT